LRQTNATTCDALGGHMSNIDREILTQKGCVATMTMKWNEIHTNMKGTFP
jgi:hypothetical protein